MRDSGPSAGLPLALVVGDQAGGALWIEPLLVANGFAVLRTPTAQHALARARTTNPDLVVTEAVLPGMSGLELCRTLREDPRTSSSMPLLVVTPHAATREQRVGALRMGVWDCVSPASDPTELVLKLQAYMRAKMDADRSRLEGLLDTTTGLYNRRGMARRVQELGSQAFREHGALACIVLALDLDPAAAASGDEAASAILTSVEQLKTAGRLSDVLGRLGPTEFAVIAPSTGPAGAVKLAERLIQKIKAKGVRQVRVGYEAATNVGYEPIQPVDLLVRASTALRRGSAVGGTTSIRRYDEGGGGSATHP